jgi:glc operon protein GlcG
MHEKRQPETDRPITPFRNLERKKSTMPTKFAAKPFVSMALFALIALPALAQPNFAPPPQVPYGLAISTENAKSAAAAAIAEARKNNWKMAVAVVDTGGYLVYFEKMQDTQTGSVELAIEKARTAALFRRPTKVFQEGVAAGGDGLRLLRLTGAIPIDGGVPIVVDGKLVGAVGVSGGSGEQDGQVARAGAGVSK